MTGLVNTAKNSGFVQNLSGAAKNKAGNNLMTSMNSMSDFKNTNKVYGTLKNNVADAANKVKNIDNHLPGDINKKVDNAKKNVDYLSTKNKTLLEKGQSQGKLKNLFDSKVRNAQKEVSNAQSNLSNITKEQARIKNSTLTDFNTDLDKHNADFMKFKDTNDDFRNLNKGLQDSQSAYDKAVRSTKKTRTAVIGGLGATAYGVNKINTKDGQNQGLNYISQ